MEEGVRTRVERGLNRLERIANAAERLAAVAEYAALVYLSQEKYVLLNEKEQKALSQRRERILSLSENGSI